MKYRNREITRIQRNFRKAESRLQSKGFKLKKRPRWRQIDKARGHKFTWKDIMDI